MLEKSNGMGGQVLRQKACGQTGFKLLTSDF